MSFYYPQTKFAKVMFLHMSVCPRGVCIPACLAGFRPTPKGSLRGLAGGGVSPGPHLGRGSPGPHPGGFPVPHPGCLQALTGGGSVSRPTPGKDSISEYLNHSTSKPQVIDMIFKLTLIHAPLFLSDSLNVLADREGGARDAPPGSKFFHFHAVFGQKMF